MAFRRVHNQYITTQANANEQFFDLDTPDNFQKQTVKSFFSGVHTAGVQIRLVVKGDDKSSVDCTRFNVGPYDVSVDTVIPPSIAPKIGVTNLAGSAITNLPFMLEYEVDQE